MGQEVASRKGQTMTKMANEQWETLAQEHEMAYFRADVCLGSPQSFSLEEKKQICAEMDASTAEIDAALRKDFESLPPETQGMLLDMLCASGCMTPDFRKETLLGTMPDSLEEITIAAK